MKILIVGVGISGCTAARLLSDNGHDVSIIEKSDCPGGLCITRISPNGLKYEPFGSRIFHTRNSKVKDFVLKFDSFNNYVHRKGIIINDKLFPFPITKKSIEHFKDKEQIFKELEARPSSVDTTNFETACLSIFGKTLYSYFIKNYTEKMWGVNPDLMTGEWAARHLELRDGDEEGLFRNQWQGLPEHGYSFLLGRMIDGIPAKFHTTQYNPEDYDVVVSSAPIDSGFGLGELQYRSMRFDYRKNEEWEDPRYGTINLPQHEKYVRKCNFKILHHQELEGNWIQYQEPIGVDENNIPMYPIIMEKTNKVFDRCLKEICKTNICPIGRLGLFKYLSMDRAVEIAFAMVPLIENWLGLEAEERYKEIKLIINSPWSIS